MYKISLDKFSGKMRGALTACCAVALLLVSVAQAQPIEVDKVIAVVDEDVVLKSEFDARWAQVEEQIAQAPAGSLPPMAEIRKQVLDELISEHLQLQMAERAGVRIDDNQLNQELAGIAQSNNMTFEQFRDALNQQGLYESTREALRKEIIIANFQRGAVNRRIEISRQEVENYLRSESGMTEIAPEYRVAHILIPNTEGTSAPAREELAGLLAERIRAGENIGELIAQRQISGIPISGAGLDFAKVENLPTVFQQVVPTLDAGEVSAPFTSPNGHHIVQLLEVRGGSQLAVNQSLVRHILIKPNDIRTEAQAEALINALYQRILNGEDFADVARQNTDDPSSMVNGGNLDWINTGMLPDDFMEVVNNTPVGTLTAPFHVSTGWHIVEVLDRRTQDVTEENKRFQAEQLLRRRKFETELQNWMTEIRATNYIDIKDPEFAAVDDDAEEADADANEDEDEADEESEDN